MSRRLSTWALVLALQAGCVSSLVGQEVAPSPWPGLRLRDALEAVRVIREAGVISHAESDGALKPVFLRSDRDIRMRYLHGDETMWFALDLKSQEIDPREWWILWGGELVNLAVLFTYAEEIDPQKLPPVWKKSTF